MLLFSNLVNFVVLDLSQCIAGFMNVRFSIKSTTSYKKNNFIDRNVVLYLGTHLSAFH